MSGAGVLATAVPLWVEVLVAVLLLASGALTLIGAIGLVRMKTFFLRMHAASVIPTLATACAVVASILYFSFAWHTFAVYQLVVLIFLAVSVPVPTLLLTRVALFRNRQRPPDEA
ncbi:MAG: monovalent cation/H(+) antiporter subunit G [Burkholderiales bacterium]